MKSYKTLLIVFVCQIFLFFGSDTVFAYANPFENPNHIDLNVVFQRVSHQNPWMVGEPFVKKSKAIHLGNGIFFAITLNQQRPVYADFDSADYALAKLSIVSYDPETGFLLLKSLEKERIPVLVSLDAGKEAKFCPKGKTKYIQLPFSQTFLKATLLEKKESEEPNFLISNGILCGLILGDVLVPSEYVRHFAEEPNDKKRFAHPGIQLDISPTPSERAYFLGPYDKGTLVSEVFPGVGPAYSLFPGDCIVAVNGQTIHSVSDWDKRDKLLDLILREKSGALRKTGSMIELTVYRNRRLVKVTYPLSSFQTDAFLIPEQAKGLKPLYFISGGFFFTELTGSYLKEFGEEYRAKSDKKLLYLLDFFQSKAHPIREKIVILSRVFPAEGNSGYHDFQDLILQTVNGERITSLGQLKRKIEQSEGNYLAFEFSGGKVAVFTRSDLKQIQNEIFSLYKISRLSNLDD